jgi:nucleoid-associated protein YgaU
LFPLRDSLGNSGGFGPGDAYSNIVEVIGSAADTKAPVLTSWKLIETKADISSGSAKVSVEFSVTDETFIQTPNISFSSRSTTQSIGFATVEKIAGNDKAATFRATTTVPVNSAPGQWSWSLFPLRDSLGNSGGFGPGDAYSNIVEVIGSAADTTQATKAKQEADAKAAADKAAADKAAADKAAADKAAADKAAADKAAAEAKASNTALIPPGNVSCSLSSSGVNFGVSLTFTSGNVVIGNLTYDWDYALLIEGRDPTLVSSYSSRTFFRSTSANSLNLSYEELLTLASKNPASTVLVFASPKNSLPEVSVKNTSGKGCYVELNSVLKNKLESEKNAADAKAIADKAAADAKAIADKAAADAKAIADKAAADAKAIADKAAADAKAIADKAAADANRREQLIIVLPLRSGIVPLSSTGLPLKVNSTSNLSVFAYNSTNDVCEYQNGMIRTKKSGRCVIAFSQEGNSEFKPAGNLILDFTIAAVTKKTTITCIKGKLTKKVTSLAPQCPAGYKKK